jgi:SagB-type dehydrogenase family enzyme
MGRNRETAVARRYHEATSHTHFSVHTSGHFLDWDNQPLPFKIYEDLPAIPLEPFFAPLETPLFGPPAAAALDLPSLARLLFYAAGVTRRKGPHLFRAAACTGALYEIDLYVACGDLGSGVGAGLYHFSPHDFSLRRLREGDWRPMLATASAEEAAAELSIVSAATWWRNAWKYQARTYRHFGWDNGTILANLSAVAEALGQRPTVRLGFVDDAINALLGLDPRREVAMSIVDLGGARPMENEDGHRPPPLELRTVPLSATEVDYPLMRQMHSASGLESADEVRGWRRPTASTGGSGAGLAEVPVHEVITRRGSTRRFERSDISLEALGAMLGALDSRPACDWAPLCDLYLIVHAVEGMESGTYFRFRPAERHGSASPLAELGLVRLAAGDFRAEAEYLDLEQELAGDAAVNFYFMADLEAVLDEYGNRGYRAAQLEAGMLGGRVYLAAYALGLGATGLTFFDEDVSRFFAAHADAPLGQEGPGSAASARPFGADGAGRAPMFLVAAGPPSRRRARGPVGPGERVG